MNAKNSKSREMKNSFSYFLRRLFPTRHFVTYFSINSLGSSPGALEKDFKSFCCRKLIIKGPAGTFGAAPTAPSGLPGGTRLGSRM